MYRVIVIDDEMYAADSLRDCIAIKFEDQYDAYSVYSAHDALELMKRSHFDIVITDIKMPDMNGIDLLRKIKVSWPACHILLMSGYDHFDYIYQAMKEGGNAYILKSDLYNVIGDELEKATYAIEKKLSAALNQEKLSRSIHDDESFKQCFDGDRWSQLVNRLATKEGASHAEIEELEALNFPIENNPYSLVLFQANEKGVRVTDTGELIRIGNGMMELFRSIINGFCGLYGTLIMPHLILVLIQSKPETELLNHHIINSAERVQTALKMHMGIDVDALIINDVASLSSLCNAVDRTKNALYSLELGSRLINITDQSSDRISDEHYTKHDHMYYLMMAAQLSELFQRQDAQEICSFLRGFAECFNSTAPMRYTPLIEVYMSIASSIFSYVAKQGLYDQASRESALYKLFLLDEFKSWPEAYSFLLSTAQKVLLIGGIVQQKPTIIEQVIAFIDKNVENDLSLITIGMAVGLNSSYLSRLFRKETGRTLSEYICERRVRHACHLLANENLRMSDIAERIGITSVNYFYSFFKKEVGMTPQNYRESISITNKNDER